ncbi:MULTISPECIES: hypothetical protein [unclassified Hydrogenophaga]|uniref:hypothetical protein n=1 Tax=unclassified Hydrogenophaga TaxID=2610897 RepID=UPI0012E36AF9|nr:hypothetical protein [Hydrogenophaga sp. Root209]
MTERFAVPLQPAAEASQRDHQARACSPGQTHKPLTLAAVLRHVLVLERPATACAARELAPAEEPALRRVNRILDTALETCLQLDSARQRLQNAIAAQRELEIVLEMLAARLEAGQADQVDHRKVIARLASARETVTQAVGEWNRVGRRFTQLTRLLPAQLETGFETLGLVLTDEMDRLAHACLSTHADVQFSLNQRAQAWAARRTDPACEGGFGPEDFGSWLSSLESSRAQAATDFSSAREAYLQAVLNFDREHARLVRARSLRRTAETGFRLNARSAPDFADAVLEESRRNQAVLTCQWQRQATGYHLYALAGLLPRQFGLIDPAAGY